MGIIHISGEERGPRGLATRCGELPATWALLPSAAKFETTHWSLPDHPLRQSGEPHAIDSTTSPEYPWAPVRWHVYVRGVWHDAPTLREALDAAWAAVQKGGS